jgi:hypothetical protein
VYDFLSISGTIAFTALIGLHYDKIISVPTLLIYVPFLGLLLMNFLRFALSRVIGYSYYRQIEDKDTKEGISVFTRKDPERQAIIVTVIVSVFLPLLLILLREERYLPIPAWVIGASFLVPILPSLVYVLKNESPFIFILVPYLPVSPFFILAGLIVDKIIPDWSIYIPLGIIILTSILFCVPLYLGCLCDGLKRKDCFFSYLTSFFLISFDTFFILLSLKLDSKTIPWMAIVSPLLILEASAFISLIVWFCKEDFRDRNSEFV